MEVRFLDDMRRKSAVLPPMLQGGSQQGSQATVAATGHLGIAECYERVHLEGVKLPLLEGMASNAAAWLEAAQRRVAASEAAMAACNPPLFQAVLVSERYLVTFFSDPCLVAKRGVCALSLCRIRTVHRSPAYA